MERTFHSHANKTHLHKKGCALGLILKVRVFGTRKWPISWIVIIKRWSPFPSSSASWIDDRAWVSFRLCSHYSGQLFVPTRKAIGYGMNTYPIIYVTLHFNELEIGAVQQLRSVTEIAPKPPSLCVNRIPTRYGLRADPKVSGSI